MTDNTENRPACFSHQFNFLSQPRYRGHPIPGLIRAYSVLLSLSDFHMLDCTVFCDMLVSGASHPLSFA